MADARVWRSLSADDCVAVLLDGLTALFDRRSGQTHVLASPLPEILHALGAGPATTAELQQRLAKDFDLATMGGEAETVLMARLSDLAALGLVSAS
jgi:PqqD family protein of HPr-rel-A system